MLLCLGGSSSAHPFVLIIIIILIILKHILLCWRNGGRRALNRTERTLESSLFEPSPSTASTGCSTTSPDTSSSSRTTSSRITITGVNHTQTRLRICFLLRSPRLLSSIGVARQLLEVLEALAVLVVVGRDVRFVFGLARVRLVAERAGEGAQG